MKRTTHADLAHTATFEPSFSTPSNRPAGDFFESSPSPAIAAYAASSSLPPRAPSSKTSAPKRKKPVQSAGAKLVDKIAKATRKVARKLGVGESSGDKKHSTPSKSSSSFPAVDEGQREAARPYPKNEPAAKSKRVMATMIGDDLALGLPIPQRAPAHSR
jgi:hypothetical protein